MNDKDTKTKQIWILALSVSQMGVAFVVCLVGGVWLDKGFGTKPIFSAIGLLMGFSTVIFLIYRVVKIAQKSSGS